MREMKKLGELGDVFIGLTYKPEDVVDEDGTIVLRSSNIQDGKLDFGDIVRVSCNVRDKLWVKENDILMCSRNGSAKLVGKTALISNLQENMTFGAFMTIIRTPYNGYLQYFFKSPMFRRQLNSSATTTINQITRSMLDNIDVPVFDNDTADNIKAILGKCEKIIQERKVEINALDDLIKARFIEMFGSPFDTTKWTVKELKDVSESMVDGSNVNPDYYEAKGEVLFLRIQNVWRNEFRLDDSVYITQEINQKYYYDTSLRTGDLLITKIGRYYTKDSSLGRVSVYRGEDDCANYSNNIMRVRLNNSMNSEFVNALLNLDDYQSFIKRTSKGGTDKRALSKSLIGSYPIIIPSRALQDEFVSFVEQVNKSKVAVQKSLDETQQLFDSLMQKYFG